MPEPKELAQSPNDNNKLNRDSYLRPTFFEHAEDCSWEEALTRKGLLCLLKSPLAEGEQTAETCAMAGSQQLTGKKTTPDREVTIYR